MKKHIIILLLISAYISGCSINDDKAYYSTLGTLKISGDSTIIEADDSTRLLVENQISLGTAIENDDRVIASFTLVNKTLPQGIDYLIDLYSIEKILLKPVIELTSQNADSIGNDELVINNLWLAKDFLNLYFSFSTNGGLHLINLTRLPGEIPVDTIDLEIRHNNNNNTGSYFTNALVSFDLKSLRNNIADSVVLCVKAKEYNDELYEKYVTYKY